MTPRIGFDPGNAAAGAGPPRSSRRSTPGGASGSNPSHSIFVSDSKPLHRRQLPSPARRTRGFTLVELIAALAISLLLITAVVASLDIYLSLSTSGEEAVERQQIARAVIGQMTRDIESIVFRVEDEGETEGDAEDSGGLSSEQVVEVQDPDTAYTAASSGLIGDSQSLVLHISRPSRDLSYSSFQQATGTAGRTSDLMSVSWFLASPGATGLAGEVGNLAAADRTGAGGTDSTTAAFTGGLSRLEGDRMAIEYADVQADTQALAGTAEVLAPEIIAIQFRYFDGQTWVDVWDSAAAGALPQAVEVTFGFRKDSPQDRDTIHVVSDGVELGEFVRHVIHVPLSQPFSSDSIF